MPLMLKTITSYSQIDHLKVYATHAKDKHKLNSNNSYQQKKKSSERRTHFSTFIDFFLYEIMRTTIWSNFKGIFTWNFPSYLLWRRRIWQKRHHLLKQRVVYQMINRTQPYHLLLHEEGPDAEGATNKHRNAQQQ